MARCDNRRNGLRRVDSELAGDLAPARRRARRRLMVHASLRAVGPVDGGPPVSCARSTPRLGRRRHAADGARRPRRLGVGQRAPGGRSGGAARRRRAVRPAGDAGRIRRRSARGSVPHDAWHAWCRSTPKAALRARGRLAGEFVRDVPWHDYYGPGSPLARLVEAGGKVLRLGADANTVTLYTTPSTWPTCRTSAACAAHRRVRGADRTRDPRRRMSRRQRRHRRLAGRRLLRASILGDYLAAHPSPARTWWAMPRASSSTRAPSSPSPSAG